MHFLSPLSRTLLAAIFIISGVSKILTWEQTAGYMASEGMILVPLFLIGSIVVELVGGLSILFGLKARAGATLLALYLIPVTLIFHDFWALQGMERQMQVVNFLKNLAIMGGLLGIARHGAGAVSVDVSSYHAGKHDPRTHDQVNKAA